MKKTIFYALALAATVVSCSTNEDFAGKSSAVFTSTTITAYVAQNYPDTKIVSTISRGSTIIATLNTGETVSFSSNGSVSSYSNNFSAGLKADSIINPTDTTRNDSVWGHHPGGRGQEPGKPGDHGGHGKGGYSGNGPGVGGPAPDSTHVGKPKSGGHGHDRHFRNEVSVDSLTVTINTYISTNYAGYSVIHAETETICQGAVTQVMVCTTASEPVELIFDTAGTFLFKGERIKYADVPTEISAAVTALYSTFTVMKRSEKLTSADGSVQYEVFMVLIGVRKSVIFNADGTVACEK